MPTLANQSIKKNGMNARSIVIDVLENKKPEYVPWHINLTIEAKNKLIAHFNTDGIEMELGNHFLQLGSEIGFFEELGDNVFQDVFGVKWDRSKDKNIGFVRETVLPSPTLQFYDFPDPLDARFFDGIEEKSKKFPDRFKVFQIGFSLYERAWTMRGMQQLMFDFYDNPKFLHELLQTIGDYNIAQIKKSLEFDIDAVYFGDDWGSQSGLQIGYGLWKEYIYPVLQKMYKVVKEAGKYVFVHSCGDVDELFDDLIAIGVDCFNPFQPEVMDIKALHSFYRGVLTFHGGLSAEQTLPYGSIKDVEKESLSLLNMGSVGNYIFSPAHPVGEDVSLENMLAFINIVKFQHKVGADVS